MESFTDETKQIRARARLSLNQNKISHYQKTWEAIYFDMQLQ